MTVNAQQFFENPNKFLNNLVRNQPRNDIKSRAALYFELAKGDHSAANMLEGVISWTKHSVLNSWVWKTASDWWAESRISPDQRDRVHR